MYKYFSFSLLVFVVLPFANAKTPSEISCYANPKNDLGYAVLVRGGVYEGTSRFNFERGDAIIADPVVVRFYKDACAKRTERLSEHRVPSARLMLPGDMQSLWIDKDGNVEFDAWATSVPPDQGLKILRILQDDLDRIRRLKNKKK